MTTKNLAIPALLFIMFLNSCKKENKSPEESIPTPNNTTVTNTDKLCGNTWKLTANVETNSANTNTVDLYTSMSSCLKDNTRMFGTNNIVTEDEGATKCAPSNPQTTTFNWLWTNNETKIVLANADTVTLVELNATTLKYYSKATVSSTTYTYTETWTKQ